MSTIGDLTLDMIGTARVRTTYEGATIEGTITGLDLDITKCGDICFRNGEIARKGDLKVAVNLRLGNIDLQYLDRAHPCEVTR